MYITYKKDNDWVTRKFISIIFTNSNFRVDFSSEESEVLTIEVVSHIGNNPYG